jgi:hypothetical protein
MSKIIKIILKILSENSDNNIEFKDLCNVLNWYCFNNRISGSHHIYYRADIKEIINLQPLKNGKAKAYQVKQVREIIVKYKFVKELENE